MGGIGHSPDRFMSVFGAITTTPSGRSYAQIDWEAAASISA